MADFIKKIYNCETGETSEAKMTAAEIAEIKKDAELALEQKAAKEALEAKKQEVLEKLGLTAEEAAALLA
jgi:hypothetical protein